MSPKGGQNPDGIKRKKQGSLTTADCRIRHLGGGKCIAFAWRFLQLAYR
jgi:hypothetical protein